MCNEHQTCKTLFMFIVSKSAINLIKLIRRKTTTSNVVFSPGLGLLLIYNAKHKLVTSKAAVVTS